eukprot:snap_masked-scaffold317_size209118-processed-gene-1.1 protein:Tk01600 transcript:snap_masked-scaffold317_size209118-processed-gene-1.1-mRNA-1 annotation:"aldehyde dehydrogenase family 9 member a1-a-like"
MWGMGPIHRAGGAGRRITTDCRTGPWNWIAGQRVAALDVLRPVPNIEPRTGQVLSAIPASGAGDIERAVSAASAAFPSWSRLTGTERGRYLTAAAQKMRDYTEDLAQVDVIDNGKPIWEARADMDSVIGCLEYYGGLAGSMSGQHVKMPNGSFAMVTREPYGVVGGVGAWNYPLQTCTWKAAPALACGNTFVYKPSPFTPVTAVVLGEVLKEVGIPDGVFNVVQGDSETGALLCQHPGLTKLSFTGSVPTGVKIMQAGAVGIRNVTLELGGKSPLIIFDDAHLKNAVKGALMANFLTQGEVCSNGTRVFVQRGIYPQFLAEFVKQARRMKIGDPLNEDTTVGATINADHALKVLGFIERAKKEGAKIECGGERVILEGELADGFYLSPCIVTDCQDSMEIVREEVFGSVACVLPFDTEDEAVKRANDTPYGLAGGVFTNDFSRAHRVVGALEAGSCYINTFNIAPAEVPFGGFKMSGIGRENGTAALEFYSQPKMIYRLKGDLVRGQISYAVTAV